jgi:hypothetical protein
MDRTGNDSFEFGLDCLLNGIALRPSAAFGERGELPIS